MLKITKATDVEKNFYGYMRKLYNREVKYDSYSCYTYEEILKKKKASQYLVVLNGTQIVDIMTTEEVFGLLFVYPFFTERYSQNYTWDAIAQHFNGQKYVVSTSEKCGKNFKECNFVTSFDSNSHYHFEGCNMHILHKDMDENLLRDVFEATRFPEYDADKITFKTVTGKDVNQYLYDKRWREYPMHTNENGHLNIAGFHYLQPDFWEHHSLFVAELDNVPIAVIKYGVYGEGYYKHTGLNYIDVGVCYRQKRLATRLISEFAKLKFDYPLVLSDESDMGHKCHMEAHFKTSMECFNEKEWEQECIRRLQEEKLA